MEVNKGDTEKVILIFNGKFELEADRKTLADSCFYFNRLLYGPFKEAKENKIDIYIDEYFSFEAFKKTVQFAVQGIFVPEPKTNVKIYFEMIQLAHLWCLEPLVHIIEHRLAENLGTNVIVNCHALASRLGLKFLYDECVKFELRLDFFKGTLPRKWGRCADQGHQNHHYRNCPSASFNQITWEPREDDDEVIGFNGCRRESLCWDNCGRLTKLERETLANLRDQNRFRLPKLRLYLR